MADLRNNSPLPEEQDDTQPANPFVRGLRSSATGMQANEFYRQALNAESEGDTESAKNLVQRASALRQEAERNAPPIRRVEDIPDGTVGGTLLRGAQYLGGMAGQSVLPMAPFVPMMIPGVGGALSKAGPVINAAAKYALPAAVMYGMERGAGAARQYEDPEQAAKPIEERQAAAYRQGLTGAAIGAAAPLVRAPFHQSPSAVARAAGTGAHGAGTMTALTGGTIANETYDNPNRDTSNDSSAFLNAAVGGALLSAPFGAMNKPKPAAKPATRPDYTQFHKTAEDIMLGDAHPGFKGATPEETVANIERVDADHIAGTKSMADTMLSDPNTSDATRKVIDSFGGDYGTSAARQAIAGEVIKMRDAQHVNDSLESMRNGAELARNGAKATMNGRFNGPDQLALNNIVRDHLTPEAAEHPEMQKVIPEIATTLAGFMARSGEKSVEDIPALLAIKRSTDLFADPEKALNEIAKHVVQMQKESELTGAVGVSPKNDPHAFIKKIMRLTPAEEDVNKPDSFLYHNLSDAAKETLTAKQLKSLARWVDDMGAGVESEPPFSISKVFNSEKDINQVLDWYQIKKGNRAVWETPDPDEHGEWGLTVKGGPEGKESYLFDPGSPKRNRPFRSFVSTPETGADGRTMWRSEGETALQKLRDAGSIAPEADVKLESYRRYVDGTIKEGEDKAPAYSKHVNEIVKDLETRATEHQKRGRAKEANELLSELSLIDQVRTGDREFAQQLSDSMGLKETLRTGDAGVLDLYRVGKLGGRDVTGAASDSDLRAMSKYADAPDRKGQRITFELKNGKPMMLNAEDMVKTRSRLDPENDSYTEADKFKQAVWAVLSRPDVKGLKTNLAKVHLTRDGAEQPVKVMSQAEIDQHMRKYPKQYTEKEHAELRARNEARKKVEHNWAQEKTKAEYEEAERERKARWRKQQEDEKAGSLEHEKLQEQHDAKPRTYDEDAAEMGVIAEPGGAGTAPKLLGTSKDQMGKTRADTLREGVKWSGTATELRRSLEQLRAMFGETEQSIGERELERAIANPRPENRQQDLATIAKLRETLARREADRKGAIPIASHMTEKEIFGGLGKPEKAGQQVVKKFTGEGYKETKSEVDRLLDQWEKELNEPGPYTKGTEHTPRTKQEKQPPQRDLKGPREHTDEQIKQEVARRTAAEDEAFRIRQEAEQKNKAHTNKLWAENSAKKPAEKAPKTETITRADLKANPDKVYLFGDNLVERGLGGQAKEMRGEPNAVGIPTKKSPSMDERAFFTDKEYDANVKAIDAALAKIPEGKEVVVPKAGLGTGLAQLEQRAPKTFKYLQDRLAELNKPKAEAPKAETIHKDLDTLTTELRAAGLTENPADAFSYLRNGDVPLLDRVKTLVSTALKYRGDEAATTGSHLRLVELRNKLNDALLMAQEKRLGSNVEKNILATRDAIIDGLKELQARAGEHGGLKTNDVELRPKELAVNARLSAAMEEIGGGGRPSMDKLLDIIAKEHTNAGYRLLASRIKEVLKSDKYKNLLFSHHLIGESDGERISHGKFTVDKSGSGYHEVKISDARMDDNISHVFLHEMVHAIVTDGLINSRKWSTEARRIYTEARALAEKAGIDKEHYGYSTLDEFLAEAFTNRMFQEHLKGMKLPGEKGMIRTAWDAIRELSAKVLGIKVGPRDMTALDEIMTAGYGLMGDPKALVEGTKKFAALEAALKKNSFNGQVPPGGAPAAWTNQNRLDILTMLQHTRGAAIQVAFERAFNLLGASGEYSFDAATGQRLIRIAIDSLNPMSAAHHESMHDFFKLLSDAELVRHPEMRKLRQDLLDISGSAAIYGQLKKLFADNAQILRAMEADPEERLAYAYEAWQARQITIGPNTKNVFSKIMTFLRRTLGIVSQDEKLSAVFSGLSEGKFALNEMVPRVWKKMGVETGGEKFQRIAKPVADGWIRATNAATAQMRAMNLPSVNKLVDLFHQDPGFEKEAPGFMQEHARVRSKALNRMAELLNSITDPAALGVALEELQTMQTPTTPLGRAITDYVTTIHRQMQDGGVQLPGQRVNNFPVVFDKGYVAGHEVQFVTALEHMAGFTAKEAASILDAVLHGDGYLDLAVNDHHRGFTPFTEADTAAKITTAINAQNALVFQPFMSKNLVKTLSVFTEQAAHRAESARFFGDDGSVIGNLLAAAKTEGASPMELERAQALASSMEGTLGNMMNPASKRLYSSILTYENAVLLPMALFSSLIDPLGIAVRTGNMAEAGRAFIDGVTSIGKAITGMKDSDRIKMLDEIGRLTGIIDDHNMLDTMSLMQQGVDMGRFLTATNRALFKYNGLELWNRRMKSASIESGMNFILDHAGRATEDSRGYMKELGLTDLATRGLLQPMQDGRLAVTKADFQTLGTTITPEDLRTLHRGLFRFTDSAVLRPHAANRPGWANDPRWALVAHLKNFTFSFHNTILKRVANEAYKGHNASTMVLLSYIPFMMASDILRGGITGKLNSTWSLGRFVTNAVGRSGVLGIGSFAEDALHDMGRGNIPGASFLGPTFDHAWQVGKATMGVPGYDWSKVALRSIPLARQAQGWLHN